jgi:hypothetical protein
MFRHNHSSLHQKHRAQVKLSLALSVEETITWQSHKLPHVVTTVGIPLLKQEVGTALSPVHQ